MCFFCNLLSLLLLAETVQSNTVHGMSSISAWSVPIIWCASPQTEHYEHGRKALSILNVGTQSSLPEESEKKYLSFARVIFSFNLKLISNQHKNHSQPAI